MNFTRRAVIAIAAGLIYTVAIAANALMLGIPSWEYASIFTVGYPLLGMFVFGAGSIYLFMRLSLVMPTVCTSLFTAGSIADHVVPGLHYFTTFYAAMWIVLAGGVAAIGIIEYLIREKLDIFPPQPIV